MKGEFGERGDAGIAAVELQPDNDNKQCRSGFQTRHTRSLVYEKARKEERQYIILFFSLMKSTHCVFYEKTKKGERLFFDPSFP